MSSELMVCFNQGLDLFKEVLQVSIGQMAAKLQDVKVGGLKKFYCLATYAPRMGGLGSTPGQWDHPQSLTDGNFAALRHTKTHSTPLQRSKYLLKHNFDSEDQQDFYYKFCTLKMSPFIQDLFSKVAIFIFLNCMYFFKLACIKNLRVIFFLFLL